MRKHPLGFFAVWLLTPSLKPDRALEVYPQVRGAVSYPIMTSLQLYNLLKCGFGGKCNRLISCKTRCDSGTQRFAGMFVEILRIISQQSKKSSCFLARGKLTSRGWAKGSRTNTFWAIWLLVPHPFLTTARCKAKLRNPRMRTFNTVFQKQRILRQKNVGQKNTSHFLPSIFLPTKLSFDHQS